MVRDSVRSGEYRTCLPVFPVTVAEKEGIGSRIASSEMTRLPHEAFQQIRTVINDCPGRNDEIPAADAVAYEYRG